MELKETVLLMNSPEWQDRFRAEYLQTKIRAAALLEAITICKYNCDSHLGRTPLELMYKQWLAMNDYLNCLETRARYEGVEL